MSKEPPYFYRNTLHLEEPDPDGRLAVPLKLLGKGAFTRAYITETGKPYVYLRVRVGDSGDYSKEALSELERDGEYSPYIPRVVKIGCEEDDTCVYRMPLYLPLEAKTAPKAWAQYKLLRKCREQAVQRARVPYSVYDGHLVMSEVVVCAFTSGAPEGLVDALQMLTDAVSNYGSDYTFEFSPRNLKVTESGHLILLDTTFSALSLQRLRAAKAPARAAKRPSRFAY